MKLSFVVYGAAAPGGSKTTGVTKQGTRFVRPASKKTKPWMAEVKQAAGHAMEGRRLIRGAFAVKYLFYRPRPRSHFNTKGELNKKGTETPFPTSAPDLTKMVRSTEDAMKGVVYVDDALCVGQINKKLWGEPARVEITIVEIEASEE